MLRRRFDFSGGYDAFVYAEMNVMNESLSNRVRHFFHVVSNVRPVYWIMLYVGLVPVFALIYWLLPDTQFRIPDGAATDYGSWLYYSIVTISTLGFGDYTPAHGWAQAVTAVEVMCGLIVLGFFLNAVGSMKSEIDVESEIEKQRRLHLSQEQDKLVKSVPVILHTLNGFLTMCGIVTTRGRASVKSGDVGVVPVFDPDFEVSDMADMFEPTGFSDDVSGLPSVNRLLRSADRTSLALDSLQSRIDLTLWPGLLEDCFAFVANTQMLDFADSLSNAGGEDVRRELSGAIAGASTVSDISGDPRLAGVAELYGFVKENGRLALDIERRLTEISAQE